MKIKNKQSLSITNKLAMTTQIQLAIKLLQLNSLDLQKEIDEQIISNPFLEHENYIELSAISQEMSISTGNLEVKSVDQLNDIPVNQENLRDYLIWQLRLSSLTDKDRLIAYHIIDYINDDGYLTINAKDLFLMLNKNMEINFQEIFAVLHRVQTFDPIGVGANNLIECLEIQLNHFYKNHENYSITTNILNKVKNNPNANIVELDLLLNEINQHDESVSVMELIKSLNPKPGLMFVGNLDQHQIIPDIVVSKKEGKWVTELNPTINPKIKINKIYVDMITNIKNKEDKEYLKSNLQNAKFFLKALKNRNLTILQVAKLIFEEQREFLNQGEIGIKPLTLKDISKTINMHESTVSRCTNNKFVQTPRGVYEMKYFFSSELKTNLGESISSRAIKSLLENIIKKEDKLDPLSDLQISDSLSKNGIKVARRTISKYREMLSIPKANDRKIK
ncbi:MAG: RNA polymerase sigma-54 factor [Gammaproteobacteria bacterium]|nr:RNA polymerase sigma-54 factor [Gammaproteobacteria bacterium]|tara:strand:- start:100171 stop:101517 length:1347 start_codon:yes stop_codon:yes gene_type:complete